MHSLLAGEGPMQFNFYNPVRIHFGPGILTQLSSVIGDKSVLVLTSAGWIQRGIIDRLGLGKKNRVTIMADVPSHPSFTYLQQIFPQVRVQSFDFIIAVGGGSVMDVAKAISITPSDTAPAINDVNNDFAQLDQIIRQGAAGIGYQLTPVIAVPTTSGTGSEVTPWGTIWDDAAKTKYSVHLPDLWAQACFCDPELTLSTPAAITIQCGLDALSHALEAIWNKNANPISTQLAITAARTVIATLPSLVATPQSLQLRSDMMLASLLAGQAFSNTKTALAHAASYYFTNYKQIPHGIACSFMLPDMVDCVEHPQVKQALQQIGGEGLSAQLRKMYDTIGCSYHVADYNVNLEDIAQLSQSLNTERAGNSLIDPSKLFAKWRQQLG